MVLSGFEGRRGRWCDARFDKLKRLAPASLLRFLLAAHDFSLVFPPRACISPIRAILLGRDMKVHPAVPLVAPREKSWIYAEAT